jgi:cytochrome c2
MKMRTRQKIVAALSGMVILAIAFSMAAFAGGPPLKEKPCGSCHKDFKVIMPKTHPDVGSAATKSCLSCHAPDPARAEANKFSTAIHNAHKEGGKTTLECAACHAL